MNTLFLIEDSGSLSTVSTECWSSFSVLSFWGLLLRKKVMEELDRAPAASAEEEVRKKKMLTFIVLRSRLSIALSEKGLHI